ncbi:hypothetical protein M422DRAFT_251905 [Sphaerobolus stellatus SS14]|uniref:Unplaced genomic scaffold SPHSTscaffold_41, whole genome shotgun sequence n=1 Tax=Sphaerobolus stellatus (strain SS14) TaxID=990650 RepID=A0A0C9UNM1_SPHS4|nr:hypothetical protein M422DRAFT_251905 [Sphaerobolus stellatus SS14]
MSNTFVFGNFTVTDGEIVKSPKAQHAVYTTTLHMEEDTDGIPALIRVFAPVGYATLKDDTTIFLYGKLIACTKGPFLIECLNMFPYPGEPADEIHGQVPSFTPRISVLGHTSGTLEETYTKHHEFKLLSSAWVRDKLQATAFMGRFDNTPRWKKVPSLKDGSAIFITGPIIMRHETTNIALIRIEDVVYNPGSRPNGSSVQGDKSNNQSATRIRPSAKSGWGKEVNTQAGAPATSKTQKATAGIGTQMETENIKENRPEKQPQSQNTPEPRSVSRAHGNQMVEGETPVNPSMESQSPSESPTLEASSQPHVSAVPLSESAQANVVEATQRVPAKRGRKPAAKKQPQTPSDPEARHSKRIRTRKTADSTSETSELNDNGPEVDNSGAI